MEAGPIMNGRERLAAFRRERGRRGVLLDFDGTLSPIVARPELAKMREGARAALGRLVPRFDVVAIISGRTNDELDGLVAVPGVRLAGMYGMGELDAVPLELGEAVAQIAAQVPGSRVEPKGGSIAVHYRGVDDPGSAEPLLRAALEPIAVAAGFEVIPGKRVLELLPRGLALKEGATRRFVDEEDLDAVLFAGDDLADLRAFAALDRSRNEGVVTVKVAVRGAESPDQLLDAADLVVDGPAGLVVLLGGL